MITINKNNNRKEYIAIKLIICPNCFEQLTRLDIEHFARCSYCNYSIKINPEIENYILEPIINKWIKDQKQILKILQDKILKQFII